ncbi:MAG: insulinase family protein [Methyloprofundus sp.]|nr:insulinase family protein [Methyloprofundus sp.]MBW6454086.1 insulinase family protein [Methyloprofundus sp.]
MRIKQLIIGTLLAWCTTQVFALAPIKHWQSSQGGRVYFVQSTGLPMVDIRLQFDAGSARDGQHQGIAALSNQLLATGAGAWNADQIAQRFDAVGAQYSASVSQDYAQMSVRSLTDKPLLDQALTTFQAITSLPQFKQDSFLRIKSQMLVELKQQQERPDYIAKKVFYQALYAQHPYAHLSSGSIESLNALTLADIEQFYQQYYVTKNAILVIVGDLTDVQAQHIAETLYAPLALGQSAKSLANVVLPSSGKIEHIDFPSTQTHVLAGLPVLSIIDADYFPLYVGNHILGGSGLVSILFNEIREQRGLAYSAYSYFSPLAEKGPFTLGLQTQNKQSTVAIEVLQKTLHDFIENGPSEAELVAAKRNITGGFVLRIDNNSKLLDYVAMIAFYQLPLDYLATFQSKVLALRKEDIKAAFKRRIPENLLQIISVGGASE